MNTSQNSSKIVHAHDTFNSPTQTQSQTSIRTQDTAITLATNDLLQRYQLKSQQTKRDHSAPRQLTLSANSKQKLLSKSKLSMDDSAPRNQQNRNTHSATRKSQQEKLNNQFNEEINSLPNFEYISLEEKEFIENFISQSENEIFNLKRENIELKNKLQTVKQSDSIEMSYQKSITHDISNMISEIAQLKATEQVLAKNLDEERQKSSYLNETIFNLHKRLNDSNDFSDGSPQERYTIKLRIRLSSENECEGMYSKIVENLKAEGFVDKFDVKEVIVYLYEQRCELVRQLNDVLFYMRQLGIECEEPNEGIKKLYEEVKSYKNEIDFLNDQVWTYKAEQQYQIFEFEKRIKELVSENEELRKRSNPKVNSAMSYHEEKSFISQHNASINDIDHDEDVDADDDTETTRHYRSSLEVMTAKVVNIPIEMEEEKSFVDTDYSEKQQIKQKSLAASRDNLRTTESVEELKVELLQKELDKLEKINLTLQVELKQSETQRNKIENQLKHAENENHSLECKYEQKIQYLNEKIEQTQGEHEKYKVEHNEYKQKYKVKTYELKKRIEQYETEICHLNKKFNLHEIEIEKLKYEVSHRIEENTKLKAEVSYLNDFKQKSIQLEEKLNIEHMQYQSLVVKISTLEHELQVANKSLVDQHNGMQTSNEKILDNFKSMLKEQIECNKNVVNVDEYKMRVKEIQLKLNQEKLAKESLEIKLKLLESDNQSLRHTLLNSCRVKTPVIKNRNRIDEINELIERAQLNAQNIIAGNPSLLSLVEIK